MKLNLVVHCSDAYRHVYSCCPLIFAHRAHNLTPLRTIIQDRSLFHPASVNLKGKTNSYLLNKRIMIVSPIFQNLKTLIFLVAYLSEMSTKF